MDKKIGRIYCIEATVPQSSCYGYKYIGQTRMSNREYHHIRELELGTHYNSKLQNYYNKHGISGLSFFTLLICPIEKLDLWEKAYIKKFNSIKKGFNIIEGGNYVPHYTKSCTLRNMVTKKNVTRSSIIEFAKEFDLCRVAVGQVLRGKANFVKEWYNPKKSWRPKYYKIVDPQGNQHEIVKIVDFANKHGLNDSYLREVLRGAREYTEGWHRPNSKNIKKKHKYRSFKFINKDGRIEEGKNLAEFSRKYNLWHSQISNLLNNKISSYKGWKNIKIDKY